MSNVSRHMPLTNTVAWYAAVVATVVFVWDIVKWLRIRPRLRVNATCNVSYPDARVLDNKQLDGGGAATTLAEYCHVEVLNTGGQPTTLIDIQVTHIPKRDRPRIGSSSVAFALHAGSKPLPALLGPGEMWSARVEMGHLETIAEHGSPIIRIRASHCKTAIDATASMRPVNAS